MQSIAVRTTSEIFCASAHARLATGRFFCPTRPWPAASSLAGGVWTTEAATGREKHARLCSRPPRSVIPSDRRERGISTCAPGPVLSRPERVGVVETSRRDVSTACAAGTSLRPVPAGRLYDLCQRNVSTPSDLGPNFCANKATGHWAKDKKGDSNLC